MIEYNFLTRNTSDKNIYKEIYDIRVKLKKEGKKKEQAPYKICLNSQYGVTKDRNSKSYDPMQANNICINGQLLILDLLEKLEGHISLIQTNTDGIIYSVEAKEEENVKKICSDWCKRTRMGMGFDEITEIWQGNVNSYIFRFANGKLERKGGLVGELNALNYDLPIVNKAMVAYLTEDVPVDETIHNCDSLMEFQRIVRVSSKYDFALYGREKLYQKTFRIFASKDVNDKLIKKGKNDGTVSKFDDTSEHCFIYNKDVTKAKCSDFPKLDKQWYIDLAKKRLEKSFGVVFDKGLFDI